MSNGVTGGNFATLADLQASKVRVDTKVSLNGIDYTINSANFGDGLAVNSLFANPVVGTTTSLINSTLPANTGDVREANGYTSSGDGGGAKWKFTGVTGQTPSQTPVQLGDGLLNDGNGNQWELSASLGRAGFEVNIKSLGAKVDGVTDDYSVINAARNYFQRKHPSGGVVNLGLGVIAIGTEFINSTEGLMIRGEGKGDYTNSKSGSRATAATRLLWVGLAGETMITLTSDPDNTGTQTRKNGGGVVGVCLDGGEVAGQCIDVLSWGSANIDIVTCYATIIHWKFDTLTNGTAGSSADTQSNTVSIVSHDVNSGSQPTTQGILHGDTSANTSLNHFVNLILTPESTSIALELGGCDGNTFDFIRAGTRATAIGQGGKIILHADDTMTTVPSRGDNCRHNNISFVQAAKGLLSKATVSGSSSAVENTIIEYSGGNGSPIPTVEIGSILSYKGYNGVDRVSQASGLAKQILHRPNATANNNIGSYAFQSDNSTGASVIYSRSACRVVDNTDSSEDGQYEVYTYQSGSELRPFFAWKGLVVGGAGDKGFGTMSIESDYYSNNERVLGSRISGWVTPSGASSRVGYDTATATTQEVAEALKALIQDLKTHGMIGT